MRKIGLLALFSSLVLLVVQLTLLNEAHLVFATLFPLLVLVLPVSILRGQPEEPKQESRGRILQTALVLFALIPFAFFQTNEASSSSWKEVGILLSGPYKVFLLILAVPFLLGFVVVSRNKGNTDK